MDSIFSQDTASHDQTLAYLKLYTNLYICPHLLNGAGSLQTADKMSCEYLDGRSQFQLLFEADKKLQIQYFGPYGLATIKQVKSAGPILISSDDQNIIFLSMRIFLVSIINNLHKFLRRNIIFLVHKSIPIDLSSIQYFYFQKGIFIIQLSSVQMKQSWNSIYLAHLSFFVFGTLFTLSDVLGVEWSKALKLVPMIILIAMLIPYRNKSYVYKAILGLGFGSIGDALLQYAPDNLFAAGAASFMIGHFLYALAFLELWQLKNGALLIKRKIITLLIVVLFISLSTTNLIFCISDKLKEQDILLVYILPIYSIFLSITAIIPVLFIIGEHKISNQSIFLAIGGILFFISDNLIGKDKFTDYKVFGIKELNGVIIMASYYLSQYFITMGIKQDCLSKFGNQDSNLQRKD